MTMTRGTTSLALAVWLLALAYMAAPVALAAEGDTNFTNVVTSGDVTVGDALVVSGATTLTGAVDAQGHITLATNKDLLGAVDGTSDVGAVATCIGTVYADNIQGTTSTGVILKEGATLATNKDLVGAADGTSDIGSIAVRMGAIHTDSIFVSPVTSHWSTDRTVTATETFVTATGENAETDVTLPNATTVTGRIICVMVSDTTTNNVLVKVATSGKIATSASPAGSGGVAGATGVTASANGSCGCWVSDGTDYDLVLASGTWASP